MNRHLRLIKQRPPTKARKARLVRSKRWQEELIYLLSGNVATRLNLENADAARCLVAALRVDNKEAGAGALLNLFAAVEKASNDLSDAQYALRRGIKWLKLDERTATVAEALHQRDLLLRFKAFDCSPDETSSTAPPACA